MYLVSFSEICCYCIEYQKFSGRFSGIFCKDIEEVVEVFKRHYFSLADKIVSSNVYMSAHIDFSKYILVKEGDKLSLVLTPLKVHEGIFVSHYGKKRSWEFVCEILGYKPELLVCYID